MRIAAYVALFLVLCGGALYLLMPRFNGPPDRKMFARLVISDMKLPFETFKKDVGRYPTTEEGFDALIHCPARLVQVWKGPYLPPVGVWRGPDATRTLELSLPTDPWGHDYRYCYPGIRNTESYDFWCLGPDGVESDDDISNWKE
jgi:general secretion pathway protein G